MTECITTGMTRLNIMYVKRDVTGGVFIVIFVGIGLACITLAFEYWWYKYKKNPQVADTATVVAPVRQIPTAGGGKMETGTTLQGFQPRNPAYPGHHLR